jgi:hypothetical protein
MNVALDQNIRRLAAAGDRPWAINLRYRYLTNLARKRYQVSDPNRWLRVEARLHLREMTETRRERSRS